MIEDNILSKLEPINEYANYKPNQLIASEIGKLITGMGFCYNGFINEPNSDNLGVAVQINVELNEDDVDSVMSDNVIYCYIDSTKIDYFTKLMDDSAYNYANIHEALRNNHFVPRNPKAWRDSEKLYLLKMNMNSGVIGRYDPSTDKFKNQKVNWKSATPEEIAELLLTKEYLEDYFRSELNNLECYVNLVTSDIVAEKARIESE